MDSRVLTYLPCPHHSSIQQWGQGDVSRELSKLPNHRKRAAHAITHVVPEKVYDQEALSCDNGHIQLTTQMRNQRQRSVGDSRVFKVVHRSVFNAVVTVAKSFRSWKPCIRHEGRLDTNRPTGRCQYRHARSRTLPTSNLARPQILFMLLNQRKMLLSSIERPPYG